MAYENTFLKWQNIKEPSCGTLDKDTIVQKSGVIYRFNCNRVECDEEYIGESARTFAQRLKEHLKAPSPTIEYQTTKDNLMIVDKFSIVGREDESLTRSMKESIYIRFNKTLANKTFHMFRIRFYLTP